MPGMRPVPMLTGFMRWVQIPHRQPQFPAGAGFWLADADHRLASDGKPRQIQRTPSYQSIAAFARELFLYLSRDEL